MKNKIFTLLFLFTFWISFAQDANQECMNNLHIFATQDAMKTGNLMEEQYKAWKMVLDNCPKLHVATYVVGEKLLKNRIEKATGEEKKEYLRLFNKVMDEGYVYFPSKLTKGGALEEKALMMYDEKTGSKEEIYGVLDRAFNEDKANFKNPKGLYLYFSLLVDLQAEGKRDLQEVFDTYDNVLEKIEDENNGLAEIIGGLIEKEDNGTLTDKEERRLKGARINGESYEKIKASIEAKGMSLMDCSSLLPLYRKNFDSKKGDPVWLQRVLSRMDEKDCTDDPMYVQVVEALHNLQPSAESAYGLGVLNDKKGKPSEALKYYEESVTLQKDNFKKSNLLLRIAAKYAKREQKSTARNYAQKAIDANRSNGNAYLLIANLYGNSANECGEDEFDKRAIYWKAAEMARKAAQVDPSVKTKAYEAINGYEQRAPTKQDIFKAGKAGQTITFSCWVGGGVKVPALN